jgi:hypothetical protein
MRTHKIGRRRRRAASPDGPYSVLSAKLARAELIYAQKRRELVQIASAGGSAGELRAAYKAIGAACQEPLPAARALDHDRPVTVTRQLATLRTMRQWYLLDAPPGVLLPNGVRITTRAALGPHVAGLDFDCETPDAEHTSGVDLAAVVDASSRHLTA